MLGRGGHRGHDHRARVAAEAVLERGARVKGTLGQLSMGMKPDVQRLAVNNTVPLSSAGV